MSDWVRHSGDRWSHRPWFTLCDDGDPPRALGYRFRMVTHVS